MHINTITTKHAVMNTRVNGTLNGMKFGMWRRSILANSTSITLRPMPLHYVLRRGKRTLRTSICLRCDITGSLHSFAFTLEFFREGGDSSAKQHKHAVHCSVNTGTTWTKSPYIWTDSKFSLFAFFGRPLPIDSTRMPTCLYLAVHLPVHV